MVIPVIHSKSNLRRKIIYYTIFTSLILVLLILFNAKILTSLNYKTFELIVILILVSQISFTLFIYLSKKYYVIGEISVQDDNLIIKKGNKLMKYNFENIVDPKILFSGNELSENSVPVNNESCFNGNYIIFQYNNKTLIYELLFKNRKMTDFFIENLKSKLQNNKLEILQS